MELWEHPKRCRMVIGFPGFGLIGTITTEFLLDHLETRQIGRILFKELPSTLAVHKGKVMDPIGIYYNEKYNIVVIRGLVASSGIEWQIAEEIEKIVNALDPYDIVDIEGVSSQTVEDEPKVYYYSNVDEKRKKMASLGYTELTEGIIMGVTSTILLKVKKDMLCLFAETHSELPDSKGAAKIIEAMDKFIGLDIDYKPLMDQAVIFEQKLKDMMNKSMTVQKEADKKNLSYVG